MRFATLLLLLLTGCSSCSLRLTAPAVEPPAPKMPIALLGKFGAAHACPVDGKVVTAEHVAYKAVLVNGELAYLPLQYIAEDTFGHLGVAKPVTHNLVVDLAIMVLSFEVVEYYKPGPLPQVGDPVRWVEYDFTLRKRAYWPRERFAKVVSTLAGHIMLDEKPTQGASGSCLFNAFGEVVGIISWEQWIDDGPIGGAVDLSTLP